MKTFKEFMAEAVYRVDDRKVKDFSKNLKTYASNKKGTESGTFADPSEIPKDWKVQKGLYGTTDKAGTVGYVFPRGTKNVTTERPSKTGGKKTTMVIDKRPKAGHAPTLSTFDQTPDWKQTAKGSAEVFSSSPSKPSSQEKIKDPMKFAKDQGVRVIVGDPEKYRRRVQAVLSKKTAAARKKVKITGEN